MECRCGQTLFTFLSWKTPAGEEKILQCLHCQRWVIMERHGTEATVTTTWLIPDPDP